MKDFDLTLYLVTDSTGLSDMEFLHKVEEALQGGITFLQLREKERSSRSFYSLALSVKELCVKYKVPLIINDRLDIALAVQADGVHLGQNDLPVETARTLLGPDKIIGATAKTVQQALMAQAQGADYLGVGAIYPTTTKVVTVITEVSTLCEICSAVQIPAIAIGGLTASNLSILEGSPIAGIAVVSAIMKSPDISKTVMELKDAVLALRRRVRE